MKWIAHFFKLFGFLTGIAASMLMLIVAAISYGKGNAPDKWQRTNAEVVSTTIEASNAVRGGTYCPNILISYSYQGEHYQSKLLVGPLPCSPSKSSVNKTISRYPPDRDIEVFVNPNRPMEVIASNYKISPMVYVSAFLGVFLLIASIFLPFLPLTIRSKRSAT